MDQNNGINQQNQAQQTQDQTTASIQQQPVDQTQQISGTSKEIGPIGPVTNQEIIQPSEQEPVIAPELKEVGVENVANREHIQVNPELKAAGVMPVNTAISVPTASTNNIQMPMTEEEAKVAIKTHPAIDSIRWLGALIIEQSRKIHQNVKGIIKNE